MRRWTSAMAIGGALLLCAGDRIAAADAFHIALPAPGHDMDIDPVRGLIFVSMPTANAVAVISRDTYELAAMVPVTSAPRGIDVSPDGSRVWITLWREGGIASLDPETLTITDTLYFGDDLGEPRTHDVIEVSPGRVFVSTDPCSNGFGRIVQLDLATGTAPIPIGPPPASYACGPNFVVSPDGHFLYIGEDAIPNSLHKHDLTAPNAPRVIENTFGNLNLVSQIAISGDGNRIYTGSGQVLSATTLKSIATLPVGFPAIGDDPSYLFIARAGGSVEVYDEATRTLLDTLYVASSFASLMQFLVLPGGTGVMALDGSTVCGFDSEFACEDELIAPATPTPPDGEQIAPLDTPLRWASASSGCPASYTVFFGESDPPTAIVCQADGVLECTSMSVEPGRTYYWRVEATDGVQTVQSPVWTFTTTPCAPTAPDSVEIALGGVGADAELDPVAERLYVSVPQRNEIVVISTRTRSIVERIFVPETFSQIALGIDRTRLFIGLNEIGSVEVLDLQSRQSETIFLLDALAHWVVADLLEARPDRLVVTAGPASGDAYTVMVHLDDGNAWERIGGALCSPELRVDRDHHYLYRTDCWGTFSLYKYDLTIPGIPRVGEDAGDIKPTTILEVAPDGSRLIMATGQLLRTDTVRLVDTMTKGVPAFGADANKVYTAWIEGRTASATQIRIYTQDVFTTGVIGARQYPCNLDTVYQMIIEPAQSQFILRGRDSICFIRDPGVIDCNDNELPDDCEIELGAASDIDIDGTPDECQCPALDGSTPLALCASSMRCTPHETWEHELALSIANGSPEDAYMASVVGEGGVSVTPHEFLLDAPIHTGAAGAFPTLTIEGAAEGSHVLTIVLKNQQGAPIASGSITVEAPACCAGVELVGIACEAETTTEYEVTFAVTNRTAESLEQALVISPLGTFAVFDPLIPMVPPVPPGASAPVSVRIQRLGPVGPSEFRIVLSSAQGDACSIDTPIELGLCNACPADRNGDAKIDVVDFAILAQSWGKTVTPGTQGDCTESGKVDTQDFNLLAFAFGRTCP